LFVFALFEQEDIEKKKRNKKATSILLWILD